MKSKNDKKLEKVFKICNSAAEKYNYGPKKREKCILALKKKFGVKKKD
jgi:hypothetical protein